MTATNLRGPVTRPAGRRPARSDGSAYAALLAEVRAAGLLRKRPGYYAAVAGVNAALTAAALTAVAMLGRTPWQLAVAALLGAVQTQFAFLAHEAAHRQVFERGTTNDRAARVVGGALVGLSLTWWQQSHTRHHAQPNTAGRDSSVDAGLFAFRARDRVRSGLHARFQRVQGWLILPLLAFEGTDLHVRSVAALVRGERTRVAGVELALVLLRLAALPAFVLVVLPPGLAVAFLAVQSAVFGLTIGGSFVPNHVGMPVLDPAHGLDYLRRQVLTSRNLRGGRVMGALFGGLDLQVEHHLFPGMARPNLRLARPIVQAHCRALEVPYVEMSLPRAYRSVIGSMNRIGAGGGPLFRCPIVDRCGRL